MNQRVAKQLRGVARARTMGQPERLYVTGKNGMIVLWPSSTRGYYRKLKRDVRRNKCS